MVTAILINVKLKRGDIFFWIEIALFLTSQHHNSKTFKMIDRLMQLFIRNFGSSPPPHPPDKKFPIFKNVQKTHQ